MSETQKHEIPPTSWNETYPRLVTKNDLRGVELIIFADKPPVRTKNGLFELSVFAPKEGKKYFIVVTARDIDNIVKIVNENARFTFDDAEPWANVIQAGEM